MIIKDDELYHYGTPRHSGRYPWGSGENPYQRNQSFIGYVDKLHKKGLSETEIAESIGITTSQLRARKGLAKAEIKKDDTARAIRLKEKGYSNIKIGELMGKDESYVRRLLQPSMESKSQIISNTADLLRKSLTDDQFVDIGKGVENHLGISSTKLKQSVESLQKEGYEVITVQVDQMGTGNKTYVKVLAPPGTTYKDVVTNKEKIKIPTEHSEDGGNTYYKIEPPRSVDSKRVKVRYAEEGGLDKDGMIELRRGVDDISLGNAKYAQVRIAVDGTHYLKGMATYSDDMPDGIDIIFNTNKHDTGNKLDAMKKIKDDPENPFGATIKSDSELLLAQRHYTDKNGKTQLSCLNIVNEEGNWSDWSKNLASQMLSKQSTNLAKRQLNLAKEFKEEEYDEISKLTNPLVKKKLLESFADECDSSAVKLKAAAMPQQGTHVLIPISSISPKEIYAPNYSNGTDVVLIRYPHGGIFEIPNLKVNNKNPEAKKILGDAKDAVGINHKVAEQLSGADFDGDTVLVIPNRGGVIKTSSPLNGLKNFEPKESYKLPDNVTGISERYMQKQMGQVSNLITDMTIKGATQDEICRAVRHSMVVIDSYKHHLDYKKSYIDNNIAELKERYQGAKNAGASTLISRAKSQARVVQMTGRPKINPETGELEYSPNSQEKTYTKWRKNSSGEWENLGEFSKTTKTTKMALAKNAYELSSGTQMESVYADYANSMKNLARQARKDSVNIKPLEYSPSAKKVYSAEVASLNAKLNLALKNKPLERRAQIIANEIIAEKKRDNPDLENDSDALKKEKGRAIESARLKVGAHKEVIIPTDKEWEAIQAGAITNNKLQEILNNSDLDRIKQLATPKTSSTLPANKVSTIKQMANAGYTQAEIADRLGISSSTVNKYI